MEDCLRMKPGALRRLTRAEAELAAEMFGLGLSTARVRIFAIPWWKRAFAPCGRLIAWPASSALADFGGPGVPVEIQGVFVHELTHVWQAQNGVNLLAAKLRAGDGACDYAYDLLDGRGFSERNIEQQAMMVEHAFLASRGRAAPYPASLYAAALPDRGAAETIGA